MSFLEDMPESTKFGLAAFAVLAVVYACGIKPKDLGDLIKNMPDGLGGKKKATRRRRPRNAK